MSLATNNTRRLRDAAFGRTKCFPRPGETTWIDSMNADVSPEFLGVDIGDPGPFRPEGWFPQLDIPAAGLADGQVIAFTLQESADGITFADTDPKILVTIVGADGVGSAARTVRLATPIPVQRYLTVKQVCADGNDVSADGSTEFSVIF